PPLAYPCLWCHKKVRVAIDSLGNLKIHRDGYNKKQSIASGMILSPSILDQEATSASAGQQQMPDFFDSKLPFNNVVLNQILAVWILAEALPWNCIEDSLLRLAF
ncbi:hypothetical protein DFH28DRAFT_907785, partial [Melampsora americana]